MTTIDSVVPAAQVRAWGNDLFGSRSTRRSVDRLMQRARFSGIRSKSYYQGLVCGLLLAHQLIQAGVEQDLAYFCQRVGAVLLQRGFHGDETEHPTHWHLDALPTDKIVRTHAFRRVPDHVADDIRERVTGRQSTDFYRGMLTAMNDAYRCVERRAPNVFTLATLAIARELERREIVL